MGKREIQILSNRILPAAVHEFARFSTVPVPAVEHGAEFCKHGIQFTTDSRTRRAVRAVAFPATIESSQRFHSVSVPGSDRIR